MTVGIDFCIANTYKEAAKSQTYVKFDEKIHQYLFRKEQDTGRKLSLLTGLDPYGGAPGGIVSIGVKGAVQFAGLSSKSYHFNNRSGV